MYKQKTFTFKFAKPTSQAVDPKAGTIEGVSVITKGEALGWGYQIDDKTLDQFLEAVGKRAKKSYLAHDVWTDRTGEEVGYFDGFVRDGDCVRAEFTAFESHLADKGVQTIFEMAQKCPDAFGTSIVFEGYLVGQKAGVDVDYEDGQPAYARILNVLSIDFVDQPAANPNGLFDAAAAPAAEAPVATASEAPAADAPAAAPADAPAPVADPTPAPAEAPADATPAPVAPAAVDEDAGEDEALATAEAAAAAPKPAAVVPAPAAAAAAPSPDVLALSAQVATLSAQLAEATTRIAALSTEVEAQKTKKRKWKKLYERLYQDGGAQVSVFLPVDVNGSKSELAKYEAVLTERDGALEKGPGFYRKWVEANDSRLTEALRAIEASKLRTT
jgi:hypothetical protein